MQVTLALALLALPIFQAASAPKPPADAPRVVVLGLEGLGHARIAAGIEAGELPHLAALAQAGSFHRVQPLPQAEAPAMWTTLLTGSHPGESGVVGFITRMLGGAAPYPFFGHIVPETWESDGLAAPRFSTPNRAHFLWEFAAVAGVESVALRAPFAFDRPPVEGARVLFGLGYPDARGNIGDWFLYSSDPSEMAGRTQTAGEVLPLGQDGEAWSAVLTGPADHAAAAELRRRQQGLVRLLEDPDLDYGESLELIQKQSELAERLEACLSGGELPLALTVADGGATVRIGASEQRVAAGAWSEFYELTFPTPGHPGVSALTRAKLLSLEPHVRLYVQRLEVDPRDAPAWQPLSAPAGFAAELAAEVGLFETYGWTVATMPYKDELVDAATVAESAFFSLAQERELLRAALGWEDWRLLVGTVSTAAQMQYALIGVEEGEPEIARMLRALDDLVGEVRGALRPDDVLLVVSPSGVAPFRRQVLLNNWLADEGYLFPSAGADGTYLNLDWSRTHAYALGLGGIYLNLDGREAQGVVAPREAEALRREIADKLLELRDPRDGATVVSDVFFPRVRFDGPHAEGLPDISVGFAPPYRVGWGTTLGGIALDTSTTPATVLPAIRDNDKAWNGDHNSVDPSAVQGVLFSSVPLVDPGEAVELMSFAPTVLELLGVRSELAGPALSRR